MRPVIRPQLCPLLVRNQALGLRHTAGSHCRLRGRRQIFLGEGSRRTPDRPRLFDRGLTRSECCWRAARGPLASPEHLWSIAFRTGLGGVPRCGSATTMGVVAARQNPPGVVQRRPSSRHIGGHWPEQGPCHLDAIGSPERRQRHPPAAPGHWRSARGFSARAAPSRCLPCAYVGVGKASLFPQAAGLKAERRAKRTYRVRRKERCCDAGRPLLRRGRTKTSASFRSGGVRQFLPVPGWRSRAITNRPTSGSPRR